MKPYTSRFVSALLCMVAIGLLTSLLMWLIKPVMNEVFAAKKVNMILPLGGAIIGISLLKGIFSYIQGYLMFYIGQRVVVDIRNELFGHICQLSMDFFHKQSTGKLMSRITNDIGVIQASLTNIPGNAVRDGVTLVSLTCLAFFLNWKLACIALFVFPLAMYPIVRFGAKLRHVSKNSQQQMARLYNVLHETLMGMKVVKAFNLEASRNTVFADENKAFFNITMRSMRVLAITSPIMEFIGAVGISAIIVVGGYQVAGGTLTQGDFFAFIGAMVSLYTPIKNLSNMNNVIQQSLAAADRVFSILDTAPTIHDMPHAKPIAPLSDGIAFNNVVFGYAKDKRVINGISFTVHKGEMVALVGQSGAGKTTIINLIPRFYDPVSGNITIDGMDIADATLASLRTQIGLVTQEVSLFNDTVEQNIRYGDTTCSFDAIAAAAKLANAHQFIEYFPEGYNTVVGEQGMRLSGGERQRIALARAILKNPAILILDEATSALDSESEKLVQEALEHLIKNRTTIVVAHRLSTIRKAHRLLVIDKGKIIEEGNHTELMNKNGMYAKLYNIQFAHEETV